MSKERGEKDKIEAVAKELERDTLEEALNKALDNLDLKIEKKEETEKPEQSHPFTGTSKATNCMVRQV